VEQMLLRQFNLFFEIVPRGTPIRFPFLPRSGFSIGVVLLVKIEVLMVFRSILDNQLFHVEQLIGVASSSLEAAIMSHVEQSLI
jgi:hypothetical protein